MNLSMPNKSEIISEHRNVSIADIELDFSLSKLNDGKVDRSLEEFLLDEKFITGIKSLFGDNKLNLSENRSEDHIALRDLEENYKFSIAEEVKAVEVKQSDFIKQFHNDVDSGLFEAVIILGVGGSTLGISLVAQALEVNFDTSVDYLVVDNVDSFFVNKVRKDYDLSKCLFVISSKTFTTLETMTMARVFKDELITLKGSKSTWQSNFIAITANESLAQDFGLEKKRVFRFWDSISGRFSIWSAIGMPLDLIFGSETHLELRKGAAKLDKEVIENLSIENSVFQYAYRQYVNLKVFDSKAEAIVAYDSSLSKLSDYLQQLYMESLGKAYTSEGEQILQYTCPLIFGGVGTNDQHSYFQLLHQGKQVIPVTFIEVKNKKRDKYNLQGVLNKNLSAQRKALFEGRLQEGKPLCRQFYGGRPNVKLSMEELTPFTLGQLMAFYEHVVFALSQFQQVNCFDQWGVELGKELYKENQK
ncbi:glucose-6-phosphate isomerase [Lishizhenia tianjinensis]|uniref:Glucose-6-phosphate isomerase n=1 Tax=Lishizhenia tianjinensis TaxID=477690 RepID=A0A1I6ZJ92_9FLAO|nr:hypothetical protein [Lishizhenia tianjinensis]SFT62749.1 glucose-6-phosphate isomerase [Lishizhenia tianjinensis]